MGEVVIGWVLGADLRDPGLLEAYTEARARFLRVLAEQFPEYRWKTAYAERRVHLPRGGLAAVGLLEMAVDEALHRHWDFAFTIVPNELLPHHRPTAMGVASKALEAGVISTSRLGSGEELIERIVALALHLFGHFFGLPHRDAGPMRPVSDPEELRVEPFSEAERAVIRHYIESVVLVRLEEIRPRWNAWSFYLETFLQDPRAVLEAIWEHRPWRMPLFLGRLTAASSVKSSTTAQSAASPRNRVPKSTMRARASCSRQARSWPRAPTSCPRKRKRLAAKSASTVPKRSGPGVRCAARAQASELIKR